jgi:hypothetical protein
MIALAVGNGESRAGVNFTHNKEIILVGCNALHRNTEVDHLVCCDRRMIEESISSDNTKNTKIYVREDYFNSYSKKDSRITLVPKLPYTGKTKADAPIHWGSGPYAVLLAASLHVEKIALLGFDLYPSNSNTVNNIYKGTTNYSGKKSKPIDYSFWEYQIAKVFEYFPNKEFTIYNKQDWKLPNIWNKNNVSVKFLESKSLTLA